MRGRGNQADKTRLDAFGHPSSGAADALHLVQAKPNLKTRTVFCRAKPQPTTRVPSTRKKRMHAGWPQSKQPWRAKAA